MEENQGVTSAPDVSTTVESAVVLVGDAPLIIRTIPGQDSRERDNGLHEALSRHKALQGIIYVADWGYNAPRDLSVRKDSIDRHGIDSIDKLREVNLAAEVADFQSVTQRIKEFYSRTKSVFWLIVVVNKADLFFDRLGDAEAYYHSEIPSLFSNAIADLRERIGGNNFYCRVVPVSAWHEDFEWNEELVHSHLGEKEARAFFLNMQSEMQRFVSKLGG